MPSSFLWQSLDFNRRDASHTDETFMFFGTLYFLSCHNKLDEQQSDRDTFVLDRPRHQTEDPRMSQWTHSLTSGHFASVRTASLSIRKHTRQNKNYVNSLASVWPGARISVLIRVCHFTSGKIHSGSRRRYKPQLQGKKSNTGCTNKKYPNSIQNCGGSWWNTKPYNKSDLKDLNIRSDH